MAAHGPAARSICEERGRPGGPVRQRPTKIVRSPTSVPRAFAVVVLCGEPVPIRTRWAEHAILAPDARGPRARIPASPLRRPWGIAKPCGRARWKNHRYQGLRKKNLPPDLGWLGPSSANGPPILEQRNCSPFRLNRRRTPFVGIAETGGLCPTSFEVESEFSNSLASCRALDIPEACIARSPEPATARFDPGRREVFGVE